MNVALLRGPGDGALADLLDRRARDWIATSFPGARPEPVAGGLGDALRRVAADEEGLAVVVPELAVWRPELAAAARDDLADGCGLSFGPVFDGGLYLLVLSAAGLAAVRETDGLGLDERTAIAGLVDLAERRGFEIGMLQAERGLRTAADARALAVDPLCDPELRAILG